VIDRERPRPPAAQAFDQRARGAERSLIRVRVDEHRVRRAIADREVPQRLPIPIELAHLGHQVISANREVVGSDLPLGPSVSVLRRTIGIIRSGNGANPMSCHDDRKDRRSRCWAGLRQGGRDGRSEDKRQPYENRAARRGRAVSRDETVCAHDRSPQ